MKPKDGFVRLKRAFIFKNHSTPISLCSNQMNFPNAQNFHPTLEFLTSSSILISVFNRSLSTSTNSPPINSSYVNSKYINLPLDTATASKENLQKLALKKEEKHLVTSGNSLPDQAYIYDSSSMSNHFSKAKGLETSEYSGSDLDEITMNIRIGPSPLKGKNGSRAVDLNTGKIVETDSKNVEEFSKPRKRRNKSTRTTKIYKTKAKEVEATKAKAIDTIRKISGLTQYNHPTEQSEYSNNDNKGNTRNLPGQMNFPSLPSCSETSSSSTFTATSTTPSASRKIIPRKLNDNDMQKQDIKKSRFVMQGKEENVTRLTRKFRLWNPFAEKRKALDQRYKKMVTNTMQDIIKLTESKDSLNPCKSTSFSSEEHRNSPSLAYKQGISHVGTSFHDAVQLLHIIGENAPLVERNKEDKNNPQFFTNDVDLNFQSTHVDTFMQAMQQIDDVTLQNKLNGEMNVENCDQKKSFPVDDLNDENNERAKFKIRVGTKIAAWIRRRQLEDAKIEAIGKKSIEDDHAIEVLLTAKSRDIDKFFAKLECERTEEEERLSKDLEEDVSNLCSVLGNENYQRNDSYLGKNCLSFTTSDESLKSMIEACIEEMKLNSPSRIVGFDTEWKPAYMKGSEENKTSVIQIATGSSCLIIQLQRLLETEKKIPRSLRNFINSPIYKKVGVSVENDLIKLQKEYGIPYQNFHDVGIASNRIFDTIFNFSGDRCLKAINKSHFPFFQKTRFQAARNKEPHKDGTLLSFLSSSKISLKATGTAPDFSLPYISSLGSINTGSCQGLSNSSLAFAHTKASTAKVNHASVSKNSPLITSTYENDLSSIFQAMKYVNFQMLSHYYSLGDYLHMEIGRKLFNAGIRTKVGNVLGLQRLSSVLCDVDLRKGKTLSNWETEHLSLGQVQYAALDAIASRETFCLLKKCCDSQLPMQPVNVLDTSRVLHVMSEEWGKKKEKCKVQALHRETDLLRMQSAN